MQNSYPFQVLTSQSQMTGTDPGYMKYGFDGVGIVLSESHHYILSAAIILPPPLTSLISSNANI